MINVVLTGIGGQGTVLAAKILAQAAQNRGWHVRTAETIGMSQRGGSVVSHVRMGNGGETVASPLVSTGQADVLIAFEPGEAARVMPLLKRDGVLVTASAVVQPVSAALSQTIYESAPVLDALRSREGQTIVVDEAPLLREVGNPRALNIVLLTAAMSSGILDISQDEFRAAVAECLNPRFVAMNLAAIDLVNERLGL
jgi:indolepyruvate ferredoxin oxidoreductase beta subunit